MEASEKKKVTFQKSARPYPPYTIANTLEFVAIVEKLGGKNVSEAVLLKELDIQTTSTKSFWGKVASGKQFGLLTVEGKNYTLTEWARLILRPKDEDSKKTTLMTCFLNPELYKELCEKFNGLQIPSVESFQNILLHDYGINVNSSLQAAKAFIESARYLGIIDANSILRVHEGKVIPQEKMGEATEHPKLGMRGEGDTLSIPIILSKGTAYITLPTREGITKNDFEKFKKLLDLYITEESERSGNGEK